MQTNEIKRRGTAAPVFMQMVLIALFAALSFVAVMLIHIPYPAPVGQPFIHFGNMVTILAALLIGGWQGGLSGSIGMGLYDICSRARCGTTCSWASRLLRMPNCGRCWNGSISPDS